MKTPQVKTPQVKTPQVCFEVWENCNLSERHFFPVILGGAEGSCATRASLYWFQDRCLRSFSKLRKRNTYISVRPIWPDRHRKEAIGVQVFEHSDLWEAYKAIGYDYKTKKFSNPLMFKEPS